MESDENRTAAGSLKGEKAPSLHVEEAQAEYDESMTQKLLRKLDWHTLPFMSLIYLCVHWCRSVRPHSRSSLT